MKWPQPGFTSFFKRFTVLKTRENRSGLFPGRAYTEKALLSIKQYQHLSPVQPRERMQAQESTNQSLSNCFDPTTMNKHDHQPHHVPSDANAKMNSHRSTPAGHRDDLDQLIHHENFEALVYLTFQVRTVQQQILQETGRPLATSNIRADEVLQSAKSLGMASSNTSSPHTTLRQGENTTVDAIMQDCQEILELQLADMQRHQEGLTLLSLGTSRHCQKKSDGGGNKKEAIVVKYSQRQTNILMDWMIEHKDQPFPDPKDIALLMKKTQLTQTQVVNWTTNVRKRNRKATCEGGKKPHHFIDFLFFTHDARQKDASNAATAKVQSRFPGQPVSKDDSSTQHPDGHQSAHRMSFKGQSSVQRVDNSHLHHFGKESSHPSLLDNDAEESNMPLESLMVVDEHELLTDFANTWEMGPDPFYEFEFIDFLHERNPSTSGLYELALLPSVTDDSRETENLYQNHHQDIHRRPRAPTLDWDMGKEDLDKWAKEPSVSM
jgi:hypothetical protein